MRPPIATPAKNIISPKLFKFSLSQTKSNSEIIVEPATKKSIINLKKLTAIHKLHYIELKNLISTSSFADTKVLLKNRKGYFCTSK